VVPEIEKSKIRGATFGEGLLAALKHGKEHQGGRDGGLGLV
jgi:hypothetical protein